MNCSVENLPTGPLTESPNVYLKWSNIGRNIYKDYQELEIWLEQILSQSLVYLSTYHTLHFSKGDNIVMPDTSLTRTIEKIIVVNNDFLSALMNIFWSVIWLV